MNKYVAFLRGINVGIQHKVQMKELSSLLTSLGFSNIVTLLNSGNIIFESAEKSITELEPFLEASLSEKFGFSIPVVVRSAEQIKKLYELNPFSNIEIMSDTRLYVSFLKEIPKVEIEFPWKSEDQSFTILEVFDGAIISSLDVSKIKTPKGMEILEKIFGKKITTRNWNTLEKVYKKLN